MELRDEIDVARIAKRSSGVQSHSFFSKRFQDIAFGVWFCEQNTWEKDRIGEKVNWLFRKKVGVAIDMLTKVLTNEDLEKDVWEIWKWRESWNGVTKERRKYRPWVFGKLRSERLLFDLRNWEKVRGKKRAETEDEKMKRKSGKEKRTKEIWRRILRWNLRLQVVQVFMFMMRRLFEDKHGWKAYRFVEGLLFTKRVIWHCTEHSETCDWFPKRLPWLLETCRWCSENDGSVEEVSN